MAVPGTAEGASPICKGRSPSPSPSTRPGTAITLQPSGAQFSPWRHKASTAPPVWQFWDPYKMLLLLRSHYINFHCCEHYPEESGSNHSWVLPERISKCVLDSKILHLNLFCQQNVWNRSIRVGSFQPQLAILEPGSGLSWLSEASGQFEGADRTPRTRQPWELGNTETSALPAHLPSPLS